MEADEGYRESRTPGAFWGCLVSALVGVPLVGLVVLVSALGDCAPDIPCKHGLIWSLFWPAVAIAASMGIATRWVINWLKAKRDRY
ncbi:MAG: hypothetical protein ACKOOL_12280 [Novosphingobium sp.]